MNPNPTYAPANVTKQHVTQPDNNPDLRTRQPITLTTLTNSWSITEYIQYVHHSVPIHSYSNVRIYCTLYMQPQKHTACDREYDVEQVLFWTRILSVMFVTKPNNAGSTGFWSLIFLYRNLLGKQLYVAPLLYGCCRSIGVWTFQAYSSKPNIRGRVKWKPSIFLSCYLLNTKYTMTSCFYVVSIAFHTSVPVLRTCMDTSKKLYIVKPV
jgi:hypothetical protein